MSYLEAIETVLPAYKHTQEAFTSFFSNATDNASTKRKIRIIAKKTGILTRYSVLKDYSEAPAGFTFYHANKKLLPEPSLSKRMEVFRKEALLLSLQAVKKIQHFEDIKKSLSHIITVTCTGLFAPGLDIELIDQLLLNPQIARSSLNFMGCNAAILALKQADAICKSNPDARVLVVCTELCTLHFQKRYTEDYLLSNMLFGDGCAAALICAKPLPFSKNKPIQFKAFNSLILPNGMEDMAWQLSETGFIMNLTSYVSRLIKDNIKEMMDFIDLKPSAVDFWAIHPGGKKIIDDFFEVLKLDPSKAKASYDVLRNFGNMSSPTVLFVLKQVLEEASKAKKGDRIFSAAFGPGLSIETMQLQYV